MTMAMPVARQRPFVPVLREGDAVPALGLLDQRGRFFSFGDARGRTTIVSFIYTRCRDAQMCAVVAAKFARMQQQLRGTSVRLATLTLDPTGDTPAVLERYGRRFGADATRWSLVTGRAERVNELVARFGIVVGTPRPGVIAHTEAAIVLDPAGRVATIVDGATWLPDDLLAAADEVAAVSSDPMQRLHLWLSSSASALCGARGSTPLSVAAGLGILGLTVAALALAFRRLFRSAAAR
jgi:cytochrome oxidase Cu insertion factor (SCO1/SenC/PrrC family)